MGTGITQRDDFRMRGRITHRDRQVMPRADDAIIAQHDRADRHLALVRAAFGLFQRGKHRGRAESATLLQLRDPIVVRGETLFVIIVRWHLGLIVTLRDGPLTLHSGATKIDYLLIRLGATLDMVEIGELEPTQLRARLDRGDAITILDVRELEEIRIAAFPGAHHIPMSEIPARLGELDQCAELVVVCHHGMRSAQIAMYLARAGFDRVSNLSGGIDEWSLSVDPAIPRY
jgi:rhodanese-related sulfurtransferase